jgi:hypothetical protein
MSDLSGTAEHDGDPGTGTKKEQGFGTQGTIPSGSAGVGVGAGPATNFEPEEDPDPPAGGDPASPGSPEPGDGV